MAALCLALNFVAPAALLAAAGTDGVATKGSPTPVSASWPVGTAELVNHPLRADGWNSWFTEWPNDVNQYSYDVNSTDDVNKLIEKLAAIKSDLRQIRLCYLKEPQALGWVTRLPEGNKIAVMLSVGDQGRIDQWYKDVRKPFGVMEFTAAPIAVPPTLTIFVQNDAMKLDDLKIPDGITVEAGYVPTVFHRSNTTLEAKLEAKPADEATRRQKADAERASREKLDPASQKVAKAIDAFLEKRQAVKAKP
jgi:hypothetical protein